MNVSRVEKSVYERAVLSIKEPPKKARCIRQIPSLFTVRIVYFEQPRCKCTTMMAERGETREVRYHC